MTVVWMILAFTGWLSALWCWVEWGRSIKLHHEALDGLEQAVDNLETAMKLGGFYRD